PHACCERGDDQRQEHVIDAERREWTFASGPPSQHLYESPDYVLQKEIRRNTTSTGSGQFAPRTFTQVIEQHTTKMFVHDRSSAVAHRPTTTLVALVHVRENGVAERQQLREGNGFRWQLTRRYCLEEAMDAAREQGVLVLEVRVERGASDVSAVDDLLHGDRVVPLLVDERDECITERTSCPLDSPILPS